MIDDAVLAAIARALDQGGGVDEARAALRRTADPLIRDAAARRLRAAHADAVLATTVKDGTHALRLAYLRIAVARAPPPGPVDDVAAVEAAYAAAREGRPAGGGRWWATAGAGVLLTAIVAGAGAVAITVGREEGAAGRGGPAAAPGAEVAAERAARGAFATGGVPSPVPGDALIARALGEDVPAFLIALDRRTDAIRSGSGDRGALEAEMGEARARALAPEVREALGEGGARALEALLAAARSAADARAGAEGPEAGALAEAVAALDDALAAGGIGYFADGDVITDAESGRRFVLVYTFRVARVELFQAGAARVRALHLRRLDKLNWSHTLLGFTRPTLRVAAVLLDQLDEQVISLVAPGLAPGAPVPIFEPGSTAPARAAVEARAGELVRDEYGAMPGLDASAAGKLGKLLGRRRALVAGWEKLAAARGMTLVVPAKLRLPEGFAASVEGLAPRDEIRDLVEIDAALDDRTRTDAFAALRDALASSIERHEVQHRLDALGPQPPPMPRALEARVGPLAEHGKERRGAATARAELSAYLAELARDARTPRVGLTLIARFLFDERLQGAPESYAALGIVEGLARGLGVGAGAEARILRDGAIDRSAAAEVYLALAALPPDRLRAAAKGLWERLFGAPLPELRKITPDEAPR